MKQNSDKVIYGIYIDRMHAFIFVSDGSSREHGLSSEIVDNPAEAPRTTNVDRQQVHLQNEKNEQLRKFCRLIIDRIENPDKILIFGPSTSKFELQKEIIASKRLRQVDETLQKTDVMTMDEAERFVKEYYNI